jgi:hypothetical protein
MEHNGLPLPFHGNGCVMSLSFRVLLFPDQIDHTARQKKFLKSSGIGKEGRENLAVPFAFDQKTVGAAEEACFEEVVKKT